MKEIYIHEVLKATSGKLIQGNINSKINSVCQDSRLAKEESLFFAIKGENFDGHNYLQKAVTLGAKCLVVDNTKKAKDISSDISIILVEDSAKAILELSRYYLKLLDIKVIGVTGSTGKTSTRDMIYHVCSQKYKTQKNKGNYNTVVGVPLTILEMDVDTQVAVLEMGMDRFGEIDTLAELTRPQIGVITNIGISHMENLGSREGIFKAKTEIVNYFNENNTLICSKGEDYLQRENLKGDYKLIITGAENDNDIVVSNVITLDEHIEFDIKTKDTKEHFSMPVVGKHNAYNASLAIACGLEMGISLKEAKEGLRNLEITGKRLKVENKDNIKVINDTYNASPDSMKAAIDTLVSMEGVRKIAVLGDMFELGEDEVKWHKEIGSYANDKADCVFAIGELAENYKGKHYKNKEDFIKENNDFFKEGDVVLFKASRGMALEEVIERIF